MNDDTLPRMLRPLAQDQREVAQRKWTAPTRAKRDQKPCDIGLFSDESQQADMFTSSQKAATLKPKGEN